MAKLRTIQASFVSGEFDPTLTGRVDIDDFAKGASKLRNVYVRPQGGAFRREGSEYFATVNGSNVGRMVPFQFNDEQTYILVFTSGRMDVYRTDVSGTIQDTLTSSPIDGLTDTIISEMNWTQSADTLILVHKDLQPIEISRTSHTAWTAANITFTNIPPFAFGSLTITEPAGTITADVTTGIANITASGTPFLSSHVGQFINTDKGGRLLITEYVANNEVNGVIRTEFEGTSAIATGEWSLETGYEDVMSATKGWARSATFHKSRLVLGGLGSRPQTILMSKIGEFFDLNIGEGLDDEAIDVTIDDDEVNIIRNVFSGRGLNIFTSGGEFSIRSDINSSVTPSNISDQVQKETRHGSSEIRPKSVDGAVVFVEREDPNDAKSGRIVRQFVFNDTEQSFNSPSISVFSQHLINDPVSMDIRRATESQPANYLYMVNSDGTCAVLNSLREQNLLAWSLFETTGSYEDVAVSGNKAFFIVNRTIDGNTVRYVEVLNSNHYMDASTLQTAAATTSWSNLDHLENETVKVRGDDYILDDELVTSGAITSSAEAVSLEAGINFAAKITSLPLEIQIRTQSYAGEFKSPVSANVRLYQSRNMIVNYAATDNRPAFRVFGDDVLDDPISLFTGWKKVYLGGVDRDIEVEITQDEPLELNVLSVQYEVRI